MCPNARPLWPIIPLCVQPNAPLELSLCWLRESGRHQLIGGRPVRFNAVWAQLDTQSHHIVPYCTWWIRPGPGYCYYRRRGPGNCLTFRPCDELETKFVVPAKRTCGGNRGRDHTVCHSSPWWRQVSKFFELIGHLGWELPCTLLNLN